MHSCMQAMCSDATSSDIYQVNYQSRGISHIHDVGFHGWRLASQYTPFHHEKLQHFNLNEITSRMIHIASYHAGKKISLLIVAMK